jgi:putative SOS response-associated peptidase YedK
MPVILSQSDETRWLDTPITNTSSLFGMLRPLSSEQILVAEVGTDIYSPKIDTPKLITPL